MNANEGRQDRLYYTDETQMQGLTVATEREREQEVELPWLLTKFRKKKPISERKTRRALKQSVYIHSQVTLLGSYHPRPYIHVCISI